MPAVYRKRLGPSLKASIEEQTGIDPDEQSAVWEELALMRESAALYVELFNTAYEQNEKEPTPERQGRVLAAGSAMSEALAQVTEVATKATKQHEKMKDRFSIHDLTHVVEKLLVLHYDVIGKDHPELARKFADAVQAMSVIPQNDDVGTTLTPDDTARMFDGSIPLFEEDGDADAS